MTKHMVRIYLLLFKTATLFSKCVYHFVFPPTVEQRSLFSTPSPAFIVGRHFDDGHSDWFEVISHCSFDLHFSNNGNEYKSTTNIV